MFRVTLEMLLKPCSLKDNHNSFTHKANLTGKTKKQLLSVGQAERMELRHEHIAHRLCT
jgi:hypothetical protein